MFVRYGYASSKRNDITNFWSFGFQYEGLLEGRDDDVVGLGFAPWDHQPLLEELASVKGGAKSRRVSD